MMFHIPFEMGVPEAQYGFHSVPNWLKCYIPTAPQSTMMGQSYSIAIEGLNHVAQKWYQVKLSGLKVGVAYDHQSHNAFKGS